MNEIGRSRGLSGWAICWLTFAALGAWSIPARAIPPPKSDEDLLRDCDVAAVVRVLGVSCTRRRVNPVTRQSLGSYQGWLQVVSVTKGSVSPLQTLLVTWNDQVGGDLGGWEVAYQPGEVVLTHLAWRRDERTYHTAWWNAKKTPTRPPDTPEPGVVGQTLIAGGSRIEPILNVRPFALGIVSVPVPLNEVPGPAGPSRGLRVTQVKAGSPAQRAGLAVGDTIVTANAVATESHQALLHAIDDSGGLLRLEVRRGKPPHPTEALDVSLLPTPAPEPVRVSPPDRPESTG